MTYLLLAIAAFTAITTAFILNSMSRSNPSGKTKKAIVIVVSIVVYVLIAIYLLQQKPY
ncbi:MAG TPA: hypothetical protein VK152_13745 [Paludibacter sp.]|nr:hypothetical protein [Paludibacter sp.]